ncbi:glycine betaine/proline transport system ATP-binding protein [Antricoccus suffuscus]|uniref:Glycine betaine/proline transport system ATP-binding protein n=1 Tax=Antricoccus suffuscus TaxID=1629062 RepID=A0A2T1A005_9ACTN|nr:glycine betaine/L-proline ABC transporter ATP-binding protein [Antricoccus suffuscus]PRZ41941.1 glycine betaine/proline transport system ATP-binding protein [Antricoccus suffuscus]
MTKVRAQNVYKVFGRREGEAVKRLSEGASAKEVKNLGTAAVIDASFDVNEGEIFVVMGLSGSGKSTLIRMLNGLWKPSSGSVFVEDTDLAKASDSQLRDIRRDKVSMVFQHFALMPHRTVRENAAYALEVNGVPKSERDERADKWLDTVGLEGWGDQYPGQLSGGMQQRVGLARALAAETDILLMDEAFSALDPLIRREMQDQLIELQATLGKTIIFITHDLNEAMYVGDRIAVMRDGRIVQIGTAEQILTDPANDYVAQFVQDVDRTRVLTASSVMEQPTAVVSSNAGPRRVVEELRKNQQSGVLVTSRDRKLLGYVSDDDAIAAAKKNVMSIEGLIRTDLLNTVAPDTPLVGLFAPSSGSPIPLAVVDEQGRLRGVIPRVALLASMANLTNGEEHVEVVDENGRPHTGIPVASNGAPVSDAPQDLEPNAEEVHS